MDELISKPALKNVLINWQMECAEKDKDVERFETLGKVIDLVEQMPPASQFAPCEGCKYLNIWDGDDGYQSPCRFCKRGAEDYYER